MVIAISTGVILLILGWALYDFLRKKRRDYRLRELYSAEREMKRAEAEAESRFTSGQITETERFALIREARERYQKARDSYFLWLGIHGS